MSYAHIHISRPDDPQPAHDYVDRNFPTPERVTCSPRECFPCQSCGRRRWASKLSISVSYAWMYIRCTDRIECKAWSKAERRKKRMAAKTRKAAR